MTLLPLQRDHFITRLAMDATTTSNVGTDTEAPERSLWRDTPSQWLNAPQFLLWFAVFVALVVLDVTLATQLDPSPLLFWAMIGITVIPLVVIVWKWLVTATTVYELTTQRLRQRWGVFNKHLDELELYRVRDYRLQEPFFLRLVSRSNISLQTSDRSNPVVTLRAIAGGEAVREQIRTHVEEARRRRGVREFDVE